MGDVARLSGVSQTTVSFVINNVPGVNISARTRTAVWNAIRELGYTPNQMAIGLRTSQSRVIGLVTDELGTMPFAGRIVQGAQDAAHAQNRLLMLMNSGSDSSLENEQIEVLLSRQVDAIIFATMRHRTIVPSPLLSQVPSVLLNCRDAEGNLPSVVPDEFLGGYQAVEALISRGHRCIGMINTAENVPATRLREKGYRQALADHGIVFEEGMIAYGEDGNAGTGYEGARSLFGRHPEMTGLFCFNDRVAMGAYDALRQLNRRIPDEVAVIGFDNHEIISANLHPALTTMQLPLVEMGRWAVEAALQNSESTGEKGPGPAMQLMLPCPLVMRKSI